MLSFFTVMLAKFNKETLEVSSGVPCLYLSLDFKSRCWCWYFNWYCVACTKMDRYIWKNHI